MLNLKTSRICWVWLSSSVGWINVLISFITRTSIKMLNWKKVRNIKCVTDNRKIVIRLVASVRKKKSEYSFWKYVGQEESKLEIREGMEIGVGILLKDGWIYIYIYIYRYIDIAMNTEEKTATTKPRPKKVTFNKSMLSFKEQKDWPWKALFRT